MALPRVFFDMTADDKPVGRIVMEVSQNSCPVALNIGRLRGLEAKSTVPACLAILIFPLSRSTIYRVSVSLVSLRDVLRDRHYRSDEDVRLTGDPRDTALVAAFCDLVKFAANGPRKRCVMVARVRTRFSRWEIFH